MSASNYAMERYYVIKAARDNDDIADDLPDSIEVTLESFGSNRKAILHWTGNTGHVIASAVAGDDATALTDLQATVENLTSL